VTDPIVSAGLSGRGPKRRLSPETKWEIFLQVTAGEISQAEAARKWHVDVSTIVSIRRTVKAAGLVALAAKPGRRKSGLVARLVS